MVSWLFAAMLLVIGADALLCGLLLRPKDEAQTLPDSLWLTLTRFLDPGVFGEDQGPASGSPPWPSQLPGFWPSQPLLPSSRLRWNDDLSA